MNNVSGDITNFEKESEEILNHTYDTISILLSNIEMEINSGGLEDMGFLSFGDETFITQMAELEYLEVYPEGEIDVEKNQKLIDEFRPHLEEQIAKLYNIDEADQHITFNSELFDNIQDALGSCILELSKIQAGINAIDARSKLNLFRQSFILTVALFDALFSDTLEQIISRNFMEFINANKKYVQNKIGGLFGYSTFELFRETTTSDIIDNSPIRLLIKMLYNFKKNYFVVDGNDIFSDITEILARRNIHLHRKGIADKGYFEQTTCGTYSVNDGDYLQINHTYYIRAYEILNAFMNNLINA